MQNLLLTAIHRFIRRFISCMLSMVFCISATAQVPLLSSYPPAKATMYLDFDGHIVSGTVWNWDGPINAKPSGLTPHSITQIFHRVAEDFRIFNINITTDPDAYAKAPSSKRVRLILTPTYQWYGNSGGVAFVNSFSWGDETPAFIFTSLLHNDTKFIAEAASHEIGHTLGLQHQSTYNKSCELMTEYAEGKGDGEIGWAPIMGVGYYKNYTTWTFGTSIEGCKVMQNDIAVITNNNNNVTIRNDDHGNNRIDATNINISENKFQHSGLVNNAPDKDFFKLVLVRSSRLNVTLIPNNVGPSNEGANIDMKLVLVRNSGDTIRTENPAALLSASFDTLLMAGTYYLAVDGVNNQNISDYGSIGLYVLSGTIIPGPSPTIKPLNISGTVKKNLHLLSWVGADYASNIRPYLENSFDGIHFMPVTTNPVTANYYSVEPLVPGRVHYRLRMMLPDESFYYSNTVVLSTGAVSIRSSMVKNSVEVETNGDYDYIIFDETGRLFRKGNLAKGLNSIPLDNAKQGLLMLKVFNQHSQQNFKLFRQQ